MSEILAPAGNKNCAISAINAGADAIYLGLKDFSARSSAENFNDDELEEICKFAHSFGVKVYVALNTLVRDGELEGFFKSCIKAHNLGADALIISDLFLGAYLKEKYPDIHIHLSTQAGVCNAYGAQFAKNSGFERVVLARETALEDIKAISEIIETEAFVQGALCTCFSGQCYLSSFAGGLSGNRGKCKQPCRKLYKFDENGYSDYAYRLSLSDLSVGGNIKLLKDAGVSSFKIEGRMRRAEYVSAAVKYCKSCLSGRQTAQELSNLKRAYNRGNYTKGIAFGENNLISSAVQGHLGEFAGIVAVINGKYFVGSEGSFSKGDGFKILRNGKELCGAYFSENAGRGFFISSKTRLKNGDKAFITTDSALLNRLSENRKIKIFVNADFTENKRAEVEINGEKYYGEVLSEAKSSPLTRADVEKAFKKVDKYPFEVTFGKINTGNAFMAASEINALRRKAYEGYFEYISQNKNVKYDEKITFSQKTAQKNNKSAVICTHLNNLKADIGILKLNGLELDGALLKNFDGEKFLYLPPYLTGAETESVKPIIKNFDGVYSDGIYGFLLAKELKKKFFAGAGLNLSNCISVSSCNADYIALSKEITIKDAEKLSDCNTFYLSAGDIKVMDLIYCPFGRKCAACKKRDFYTLTDENGRNFPVRRYKTSVCRFEVYNNAKLVSENSVTGKLLDCTLLKNPNEIIAAADSEEKLIKIFNGNYTRGHTLSPVK